MDFIRPETLDWSREQQEGLDEEAAGCVEASSPAQATMLDPFGKLGQSALEPRRGSQGSIPPSTTEPRDRLPVHGADSRSGPNSGGCCCRPLPPNLGGLKKLDELSALEYASWCCYCCCAGCGTSALSSPCFVDTKSCLCYQRCGHAGPCQGKNGLFSCVVQSWCSTLACQCPSRAGMPTFVVCSLDDCCPRGICCCLRSSRRADSSSGRPSGTEEEPMTAHDAMIDQCLLWYCCCCGCSCLPPHCGELINHRTTCCCIEFQGGTMLPTCSEESWSYGWLGNYMACGRFYSQFRLPFYCKDSPVIACCGWRCRPHRR